MVKAVVSSASSSYSPTLDVLPRSALTATNHVAPSALSGHDVKVGASPDPRAGGICQRLGNLMRSIAHSFRSVPGAVARLVSPRRWEAAAADTLRSYLIQTYHLMEDNAHPDRIRDALLTTSNAMDRAGGKLRQQALNDVREGLEVARDEELKSAVEFLRGPAISDQPAAIDSVQRGLRDRPSAEKLLMEIEATINDELARRLQFSVGGLVGSARDLTRVGESSQRIAEEFHRAVELANSSGPYIEGDPLVLNGLLALPSDDRKRLLQHISSEDLARLEPVLRLDSEEDQTAPARIRDPREIETAGMIVEARTARLTERFAACHQQLCEPPADSAPLAGNALLNQLAAAATALRELETHRALHRLPILGKTQFVLQRSQIRSAAMAALESGHLDPSKLRGAQLLRLSRALHTLGIHDRAGPKLQAAEQEHLDRCRTVFQEKLGALVQLCSGNEAAPLLHALSGLEDASRALQSASLAFNPGTEAPAESSSIAPGLLDSTSKRLPQDGPSSAIHAPGSESPLVTSVIGELPPSTRASLLARAFSEPETQALISSLQVGAHLARHGRETLMADRFDNMARLYKEVSRECAAGQASLSLEDPQDSLEDPQENPAPAPGTPLDHQKFAAANLTEATRRALGDAYALSVPADAAPSLQAGHFDPEQTQTMARVLEAPLSAAQQRDPATVGRYEMSRHFFGDAARQFSLYVDDASQDQASPDLAVPAMRSPSREATANASPGGRPLIDWSGPGPSESRIQELGVSPDAAVNLHVDLQTLARITDGYSRLVEFCGGDEAQARTLAHHLNQSVMAGLAETCATSKPFSLPSGVRGYVLDGTTWSAPDGKKAADHKTSITLSIGENGRPQLDVDDRIEGRAPFIDVDGKMRYLSADSYVQTHFRAELTENGSLRLLEAPSFGFNLERDDFQKPYPPPTIELVEGLAADDALVQDVLQYANTNGMGHHVYTLRALAAFEHEPTLANANAVVAASKQYFDRSTHFDSFLMDIRTLVNDAQRKIRTYPTGQLQVPADLFGNLRELVGAMVRLYVLPGTINAVGRNEL